MSEQWFTEYEEQLKREDDLSWLHFEEMERARSEDMNDMNTDAIEWLISMCKNFPERTTAAREQLAALVENQIPGRCRDCIKNGTSKSCSLTGVRCYPDHYCGYFTKREA